MLIYLSLKQLLLNQISYLIFKGGNSLNVKKRLYNLQNALEQIKSWDNNESFKYVLKHLTVELSDKEKDKIRELNNAYSNKNEQISQVSPEQHSKQGTWFTGAEDHGYRYDVHEMESKNNDNNNDNNINYGYIEDVKTPTINDNDDLRSFVAPESWVHFRGFYMWFKTQSFIKVKWQNNETKVKQLWNTLIGLEFKNLCNSAKVTKKNIIQRYPSKLFKPYIDLQKVGTPDIVKASLFRLSLTQNRLFEIDVHIPDDIDNNHVLTANKIIAGMNLFNMVENRTALRIVGALLFDSSLAQSILEEFLRAPKFSLFGGHSGDENKNVIPSDAIKQIVNEVKNDNNNNEPNLYDDTIDNNVDPHGLLSYDNNGYINSGSDDDDDYDNNRPNHAKNSSMIEHLNSNDDISDSQIYQPTYLENNKKRDSFEDEPINDKPKRNNIKNNKKSKRVSIIKASFLSLSDDKKWIKISQRITRNWPNSVVTTFRSFCIKENYTFEDILDDISEYINNEHDSSIIHYMSNKFHWDSKEKNRFYRTLKRVLAESPSMMQMDLTHLNDNDNSESIHKLNKLLRDFINKWGKQTWKTFQIFLIEEEYDIDSIEEDLKTYAQSNSMIITEMQKHFKWNHENFTKFVNDILLMIKIHKIQFAKYLLNH